MKWKTGPIVGPLPSPSPPLKLAFRIGSETPAGQAQPDPLFFL